MLCPYCIEEMEFISNITGIPDFFQWKCTSCGYCTDADERGRELADLIFIEYIYETNANGGRHELNK